MGCCMREVVLDEKGISVDDDTTTTGVAARHLLKTCWAARLDPNN
jgi:hypothetical protein